MSIRLAVRGYSGRTLVFQERIEAERAEDLELMAAAQMQRLAGLLPTQHMIEIEFLDEPDVNHRFFRFGTDPAGMVMPIAIDLRGVNE